MTVGRLEGRNHERVVCERTGVAGDCGCSVDVWVGFLLRIVKCVFVLFFCDSTTVMSMTAHGCARDPHLATLSNTMHLSVARLRCQAWFEWVPSDANPDDIPSRPQGGAADFYEKEHLKQWQYAMCFPSMAQLRNPLFHDIRS